MEEFYQIRERPVRKSYVGLLDTSLRKRLFTTNSTSRNTTVDSMEVTSPHKRKVVDEDQSVNPHPPPVPLNHGSCLRVRESTQLSGVPLRSTRVRVSVVKIGPIIRKLVGFPVPLVTHPIETTTTSLRH